MATAVRTSRPGVRTTRAGLASPGRQQTGAVAPTGPSRPVSRTARPGVRTTRAALASPGVARGVSAGLSPATDAVGLTDTFTTRGPNYVLDSAGLTDYLSLPATPPLVTEVAGVRDTFVLLPLRGLEPFYSPTAERIWGRLPEYVRVADASQQWAMKSWLSGVTDRLGEVATLFDRINFVQPFDGGVPGDTSDLVNPTTADAAWLPWLAQLVGVKFGPNLDVPGQRTAIASAASGFRAATKSAIAAAAQTTLAGTRYVQVYDHSVSVPGDGGVWDILVVTRPAETPSISAVLASIVAQNAKPAGVTLRYRAYSATYAQTRAALPVDTYGQRAATFPTYRDVGNYFPPGA